jgi:tryptophan-rich sensory protein
MAAARLEGWPANLIAMVGLLALTYAAAALGGFASVNAGEFYTSLNRPAWAPSPAVFGPVWSVLYTLMAISAFLVVRQLGWRAALVPLAVFVVQLLLNAAWTWLFFGWRMGGAAFGEIIVLIAAIALNIYLFWRVRPLAGALLLPYLGWVSFATLLTWSVWRLNPGVL